MGRGKVFSNGLGGGGGHGGNGGDGYCDGSYIDGGVAYGDADLPCELGSGSGNVSLLGATAGGGIIGELLDMITIYMRVRVCVHVVLPFRQDCCNMIRIARCIHPLIKSPFAFFFLWGWGVGKYIYFSFFHFLSSLGF